MENITPISDNDYDRIMVEAEPYLETLYLLADCTGINPEGNCYYKHGCFELRSEAENLRKNLMTLAKISPKILEIGFNMGHSTLFMLLANPECKIDCIDICEHTYTEFCFDYLSSKFPNRLRLFKGHSHEVLKNYFEPLVDMVHIDGCHEFNTANVDFFLSRAKAKNNGIIVFDDTWMDHLKFLWNNYLNNKFLTPIHVLNTHLGSIGHSIGRLTYSDNKIALCTLSLGEEYKKIVKYGRKTKIMYSERFSYDFREDEDIFDKERPYAWSKVKLILKCLSEKGNDGLPKYDYVFWIDADTHIMNRDVRLQDIIKQYMNDKDILLAQDPDKINSGVMFIKNTEYSMKFFETLYDQKAFIFHDNWEQEALIYMLQENVIDCKDHIEVLHPDLQTEFNSYYGMYKYGQFIIHLAGCFRNDMNGGLDQMMNRYCPMRMDDDTDESFRERMIFLTSLR